MYQTFNKYITRNTTIEGLHDTLYDYLVENDFCYFKNKH